MGRVTGPGRISRAHERLARARLRPRKLWMPAIHLGLGSSGLGDVSISTRRNRTEMTSSPSRRGTQDSALSKNRRKPWRSRATSQTMASRLVGGTRATRAPSTLEVAGQTELAPAAARGKGDDRDDDYQPDERECPFRAPTRERAVSLLVIKCCGFTRGRSKDRGRPERGSHFHFVFFAFSGASISPNLAAGHSLAVPSAPQVAMRFPSGEKATELSAPPSGVSTNATW